MKNGRHTMVCKTRSGHTVDILPLGTSKKGEFKVKLDGVFYHVSPGHKGTGTKGVTILECITVMYQF